MRKITFECQIHNLKYEYPENWEEQKLSPQKCPLCMGAELTRLSTKYIEVKNQRDKLLAAIDIKFNVESKM